MRLFTTAIAPLILMATSAFGAFTIDETHEAAKAATTSFKDKHADHVQHYTGYKVWKSGDDAKVKIYVNHDGMNMEYNYTCHKHDTGIECHEQ